MNIRALQLFILATFFLISCSKNRESRSFSNIYVTDRYGQMIAGDTSDGQWRSQHFTDSELAHFSSLDTTNLTGTTKPSFWHVTYAYPNPFAYFPNVSVNAEGFTGKMVIKFVVLNTSMKPVQKGAILAEQARTTLAIIPRFSKGKYRIYITFSAEGNEHFFKTWGNLEYK